MGENMLFQENGFCSPCLTVNQVTKKIGVAVEGFDSLRTHSTVQPRFGCTVEMRFGKVGPGDATFGRHPILKISVLRVRVPSWALLEIEDHADRTFRWTWIFGPC